MRTNANEARSRALAQQLSIRLGSRYSQSKLVEVNSHSLFSRYFSESGKLVGKLFDDIESMLEEAGDTFVCVLIDEVESLTGAREYAASGSEPSDAMRVSHFHYQGTIVEGLTEW